MARRHPYSEYGGRNTDTGVSVNPMRGVLGGEQLKPNHRVRLVNTTGFESTAFPLSRRAWLGFNPYPPIPIPTRIPRQ